MPSVILDEDGNVIDSRLPSGEPLQFVFEEIRWQQELSWEEAARRLEVAMYPFKKVRLGGGEGQGQAELGAGGWGACTGQAAEAVSPGLCGLPCQEGLPSPAVPLHSHRHVSLHTLIHKHKRIPTHTQTLHTQPWSRPRETQQLGCLGLTAGHLPALHRGL